MRVCQAATGREYGDYPARPVRHLRCVLAIALAVGCSNEGAEPTERQLNFPIALALSADDPPSSLFVVNANFDLRFNSGTVQSYDLDALSEALAQNCASDPEDCFLDPSGEGEGIPAPEVLRNEVLVGSFADGVAVSPDGTRLYLPVRSDDNLTAIEVGPDGTLACGGDFGSRHRCVDSFREARVEQVQVERIEFPADPVDLYVGDLESDFGNGNLQGNYVVMVHRPGDASLIVDTTEGSPQPQLIDTIDGLPNELVTVTQAPDQTAWVVSARAPTLERVQVAIDNVTTSALDARLFRSSPLVVQGLNSGQNEDLREVVFDPRADSRRAYALWRRIDRSALTTRGALLFVNTASLDVDLSVADVVPVGFGPSRVRVETLVQDGREFVLAFVSCFDSRDLYVVDVDQRRTIAIARGLSGPFEFVVDSSRNRLYVGDFRSSVVRSLDLQPTLDCLAADPSSITDTLEECSPGLLGLMGRPEAVVELR